MYAVLAVLSLAFLIVVHEGGHYFVARWCGMRIDRFSIGFGPGIFKRVSKKTGTTFQLAPIPFGGFVEIRGMNIAEEVDPEDRFAYPNRPAWQRFITIFAGPATNYISAIVVAFLFFTLHGVKSCYSSSASPRSSRLRCLRQARGRRSDPRGRSQADHGGRPVHRIDGTHYLADERDTLRGRVNVDHEVTITVSRDGKHRDITISPRFARDALGVLQTEDVPFVGCVGPNPTWLRAYVPKLVFDCTPTYDFVDAHEEHVQRHKQVPFRIMGITPSLDYDYIHVGIFEAGWLALDYPIEETKKIGSSLYGIVFGHEKADPGGPKRIYDEFSKAWKVGWRHGIELLDRPVRLSRPVQPVPATRARRRPPRVPRLRDGDPPPREPPDRGDGPHGRDHGARRGDDPGDAARLRRLVQLALSWGRGHRGGPRSDSDRAGVYLFKDADGEVIYVGKAKSLRTRVRQYFREGGDERFFVAAGSSARRSPTSRRSWSTSAKEALLLENHLIKKHQPRFNVKLRDDKQYLVLRLVDPKPVRDEGIDEARRVPARRGRPQHPRRQRELLRPVSLGDRRARDAAHAQPPLPAAHLHRSRARDPRPAVPAVSDQALLGTVRDRRAADGVRRAGRRREDVPRRQERRAASSGCAAACRRAPSAEDFEVAAALRDSIAAVERTLAKQHIVQDDFVDQDVWGLYREADSVEVVVLFVRGGKLVGRRAFQQKDQELPDAEVIARARPAVLRDRHVHPRRGRRRRRARGQRSARRVALGPARGKKVQIVEPRRGMRARLVELADRNAAASATSRRSKDADAEALLAEGRRAARPAAAAAAGSSASTSRTSRAPRPSRRW